MLKSVGVCADAAADSRQAVEMLRLLAYDLVLMDCGMPDMESIAAAARTPIVAMTAGFSGAEHDLLMENGTRDILLKPVPRLALEAVLRKWLTQRNEVISISA